MNQEENEPVAAEHTQPREAAHKKKLGYGPLAAVLVAISAFLAAQVAASIIILILLYATGRTTSDIQHQSVTMQFFTIFLVESITIWLLWLFLRSRKVKWQEIGLVKPKLSDAKYVAIGYVVYFGLLIVATQLATRYIPGFNTNQEQELGFDKNTSGTGLWMIFISLVILPPIVEEIVARGFLFTGLRTRLKFLTATLITSSLFGLAHLMGGEGGAAIWAAVLDTFILSLILCTLREKTGSLWPSIGVHMVKNSLAFAVLFVFKVT